MVDESPGTLRDRAGDVLSQPQFQADEPGLIDRAWERFTEFLGDLLTAVTSGSFGNVIVGWLILAAMLGLIAWFLIRYLPRLRPAGTAKPQAAVTTRQRRRSRADWLVEAERATAEGRYRAAVEAWFRATVSGLVEADRLPDRPDSTVLELRAALQGPPEQAEPFSDASQLFSDIWYGGAPAGVAEAERLSDLDGRVLAAGNRP